MKEIADPVGRIQAIARDYAANPENTLIVSPDNASRRQINDAVRHELQNRGVVHSENHALRVLVPRQELTGAERQWVSRYEVNDVIRYTRGSQDAGIERGSYARVIGVNPVENLLTVEKQNGERQTYDPRRLHGVSVYREIEREFSVGDRIQFTAPDKQGKKRIEEIDGIGCQSVLITATTEEMLEWIGRGLRSHTLAFPDSNSPIRWSRYSMDSLIVPA